jgi:hypothetical protein
MSAKNTNGSQPFRFSFTTRSINRKSPISNQEIFRAKAAEDVRTAKFW